MEKSGSDERSNSSANAESSDPFEKASEAVEGLYTMRDTFFPKNPTDKKIRIHRDSNLALSIVDSILPEKRKQSSRRAVYEYLRGKVLDVSPDYRKEAEDHLSKAVKLDPSLADAWLCLGNCLWKKGDLSGAKNCFSLALKKGPNKKILRQLSMLERRLAQGTANEVDVVEESIQHAKKAVMLDVKDGQSWYALGNAYLSSFFITGSWDQNKLFQSLKAYQNAEKDELANNNPDLYYNSAMANRYVENYERALSGFEAASLRDPGLNAEQEVQKLVRLLTKLEESSINKGQMKSKRHASLLSSLGNENIKLSLKPVPMQFLHEGLNRGLAVIGRVLYFIPHDNEVPLYYVVSDAEGSSFILSIYGLRDGVIKESDTVTLLEPSYRDIHVCWKDKNHHFQAIRVDFMQQILVNGHSPSVQDSVRSTIHAQHILP
ncbi:uncharacterized protein LOC131035389 isoform X1 [Cryptomeria japonica]|uniref:uncharacterized protein LOC131035389 isoform X1 n=1 Tax=Cryptomeria japonica TaxID=3369 RepID=UPI0027D9D9B6|nr:uncharacterized protein LOC131035389 isoform X1 [Cryptomeria japonica]XP_057823059.2 uncharacterized protein LOC131035389 isoform X1 [Cryptomeria japonica]